MENPGDISRRLKLTPYEKERVALAAKVADAAVQMEAALSAFDQALMSLCECFHSICYNPIAEKLGVTENEGIKVDMDTGIASVVTKEEAQHEHTGA